MAKGARERDSKRLKISLSKEMEVYALLQQTRDAIAKVGQQEIKSAGITMTQAAFLFVVKAIDGPATLSDISMWLSRERHTVFVLLRQMEKQGLVTRVKDLKRKNAFRVILTEKGEEAYRGAMSKEYVIPEIISSLSEEERESLRACLEKLRGEAVARLQTKRRQRFPWGVTD